MREQPLHFHTVAAEAATASPFTTAASSVAAEKPSAATALAAQARPDDQTVAG